MNELMTTNQHEMFLPIMNLEIALQRREYLVKFVAGIMKDGHDYGKIPGAGDKPTLLKPGAEKLATFFGLTPVFIPVSVTEDWHGNEHNGEPFFNYRYKCELWRVGNLLATHEGSCNSHESKYRYRKAERVCPQCGAPAIIKGKAEYGGGFLCFGKKGGCGAKFREDDKTITEQETGRMINPDVADQVNTMQKMAQKRALVGAILLAVNASEFFTQDIEDMASSTIDSTATVVEPARKPASNGQKPAAQHQQPLTHTNGDNSQPEPDFYIDATTGDMVSDPPAQPTPQPQAINGDRCPECKAPAGRPHGTKCSKRNQPIPADLVPA